MKRPARKLAGFLVYKKLLPREGWRNGDEGPFSMIARRFHIYSSTLLIPGRVRKRADGTAPYFPAEGAGSFVIQKCIDDLGQGLPPGFGEL